MKVVRADIDTPAALERFEREARTLSSLRHPHIVTIHDFGCLDGQPWLAMGVGLVRALLAG